MSRVTGSLAILVPDSVAQAPIPQLFDPIDLPPSFQNTLWPALPEEL